MAFSEAGVASAGCGKDLPNSLCLRWPERLLAIAITPIQNRLGTTCCGGFMRRTAILLASITVLLSLPLYAKPKKKSFSNPAPVVFAAAFKTARERHVVTFVDGKNLMLTFESGMSGFSYGFRPMHLLSLTARTKQSSSSTFSRRILGRLTFRSMLATDSPTNSSSK